MKQLIALLLLATTAYAGPTFTLVGDSIGAASYMERSQDTLVGRMSRKEPEWIWFNVSRGGMSATPGLFWPAFNPNIVGFNGVFSDYTVIVLGANDYMGCADLQAFINAYSGIVDTALFWKNTPICVTPIWLQYGAYPNCKILNLDDYRKAIVQVCESRNVCVIDGSALLPEDPTLLEDGIHPTKEGFRIYGRNLAKGIRECLNQ